MKTLYMVGGTMGVGKTAACKILRDQLDRSVFLDGDWCWDAHPFAVTEETKAMVEDNICHMLNNFLRCSAYDHVIFCWVMHMQEIWDAILSRLALSDVRVRKIALVCGADALAERLQRDVDAHLRAPDAIPRSLARIPLYDKLDAEKLDVSRITPAEAAKRILSGN